ncbi:N-acetyl-gamma-glutamyl-phosphate reductase [Reichenbachiella carrageenanivorans]|uniref:N-acetyl-gamma-glutamyl-phosphate reductase n=1 Tax=Reichenbachiella carrageenanivorans TaxID=2979869 RepID=A0ABY6CXU6_9BACT|nr:N-acetyl-gamma-glutamyl-phosphate reductase [Reichenbachiella carrageenanivorans]UXX78746.1 N-acetyl-gamma-glutamyl-phosphate reductase [Reichenbachiella carrageenanivorans]
MIKVGVVGGAGYTAGELLRILANHPEVEVACVQSSSNAGKPFYAVHQDLIGDLEGVFASVLDLDVDVIFICSGHGKTQEFLDQYDVPADVKIIDLSNDFRLEVEGNEFVYGLPELNLEAIKKAKYLANPGCFATAIQLGVLPLAAQGVISEDVHVNAVTGSTGAGQNPSRTTHFSWRNNNVSIYKAFSHQHLGEINQSVKQLQNDFAHDIKFLPVRGNFPKGIFASLYTTVKASEEEVVSWYKDFYKDAAFVHVLDEAPDMKQVVNTNKCLIHVEKHGDTVLVTSVIDNLIKGASGQAVQNMNLMFGLDQKEGLRLKSTGF